MVQKPGWGGCIRGFVVGNPGSSPAPPALVMGSLRSGSDLPGLPNRPAIVPESRATRKLTTTLLPAPCPTAAAVVYPYLSSFVKFEFRQIRGPTVNQRFLWIPLAVLCVLFFPLALFAQPYDPAMYQELHWRMIGPFRGGRTVSITGVPGQPNVFYMAPNNGGVWKTTDFGRTWHPIFDDQPTGSIGALAVAPSNPKIIYVGSGEGLRRPDLSVGDGIYKSTDAGATWQHLGQDKAGLRDAQQIASIIVDPKDPNRLFVAAQGHPYGPNPERGIFRSLDGGQSFQKVF